MKKILFIIVLMLYFWISFSVYIDKCCIIDTINYKENLKKTSQEISKYPYLQYKVDNYISKIIRIVNTNNTFKYKKAEIYKKISGKITNYVYNNNIQKWTKSFLMLSYFTYKMYDFYEYWENTSKYNLETKLEMLNKNHYAY